MRTRRRNANAWLVALCVTVVFAVATGLVAASFATGSDASSEDTAGSYPGAAALAGSPDSPALVTAGIWPDSTPSSSSTLAPATPVPSPVDLSSADTPAPETGSPPPAVTPVPRRRACPPYSILLDPAPDLATATQGAMAMWAAYLGCPAFEIAPGGLRIRYEPAWPGDCLDPDIAACTMNGIFLSPAEPLYDPQSVIAHELGHVLNFHHGEGPPVMDPSLWGGALTVWCDLETRCD